MIEKMKVNKLKFKYPGPHLSCTTSTVLSLQNYIRIIVQCTRHVSLAVQREVRFEFD